jgi:hypothetical protein
LLRLALLADVPRLTGSLAATSRGGQIIVEKKDKIKAAVGHSPDFVDSLLAAWWCRTDQPKSSFRVRRG